MFEVLCQSFAMQKAIFGAVVCGDFLLAFLILLLAGMRKERREASGKSPGAEYAPQWETSSRQYETSETDEARRVREAKEDTEAWRQMMGYSAADAYGGGDGG